MSDISGSMGGYDVRKKESLEKLVQEIQSREEHVNLLGMLTQQRFLRQRADSLVQ